MRLGMWRILFLAVAAILLMPLPAHSAPRPAKVAICAACHGAQGRGGKGIYPRLAGQPAAYLTRQLDAFRAGLRKNALMSPVAASLTTDDIHELTGYFSALRVSFASPGPGTPSAAALARGRELVTVGDWRHGVPACMRCHASDLGGVSPDIPALAGQPAGYLVAALRRLQVTDVKTLPGRTMRKIASGLSRSDIKAIAGYIGYLKQGERPVEQRPVFDGAYHPAAESPGAFSPPPQSAIPSGPDGDTIWQGLQLMKHTHELAGRFVGNALNCVNCHVAAGREAGSAPMWAAYVLYPKYRSKNRKVNTIEERIQGCFRFSMNGKPPAADSAEIKALVTYFHWLATGLPVGIKPAGAGYHKLAKTPHAPDPVRGGRVYATNCAMCHGGDGQGRVARGQQVFPPLWGAQSFNWGAGMGRISTAAAFIKANMPYGRGVVLNLQDAWDVAAFVVSHPRPQDPRFTGNVEQTRKRYHSKDSYYGQVIDGHLLGAPVPSK
jgi:thiosulfate dehydrogenase